MGQNSILHNREIDLPLFDEYPCLRNNLPFVSLAERPTPIMNSSIMEKKYNIGRFFVKQDGLSGKIYGGNKVRKLEFLLGDALRSKRKEVITFGGAGSNHALATAVYAKQCGLLANLLLMEQPNAGYVRKNLLMAYKSGAQLQYFEEYHHTERVVKKLKFKGMLLRGKKPMVIPFGGTTPLGTVGFVNAAFELKQQIEQGELPAPDYIYLPFGSMGSAIGLMLGLKAAGLKTKVVPVLVVPSFLSDAEKAAHLYNKTSELLFSEDPSFYPYNIEPSEVVVRTGFLGKGYAWFSEEAVDAVVAAKEHLGVILEGTYTGKAFAALLKDAKDGKLSDKSVLFWNTSNSRDFSDEIADVDYHSLPIPFHSFFETSAQSIVL